MLHSRQLRYKDDKSVETAINELYQKAEECYDEDGIPLTYTKLEYIQSTGTQYIDTDYTFSDGMRFKFQVQWMTSPSNASSLFGANSGGTAEVLLGYRGLSVNYLGGSFNYSWELLTDYNIDIDLKNTTNNLLLIINNELVRNVSGIVNGKKCYLFGGIKASHDTSISYYTSEKLYYFRIYSDTELVRDYIPVLDTSKRPCLFDKVSKTCFYNQGTGEFLYE